MIRDMMAPEMWLSHILDRGNVYREGPHAKGLVDYPQTLRTLAAEGQVTILEVREEEYFDHFGERFTENIRFRIGKP